MAKVAKEVDNIPLTFGKYRDLTPHDIAENHPHYIVWLRGVKPDVVSAALAKDCERDIIEDEAQMWSEEFNNA